MGGDFYMFDIIIFLPITVPRGLAELRVALEPLVFQEHRVSRPPALAVPVRVDRAGQDVD